MAAYVNHSKYLLGKNGSAPPGPSESVQICKSVRAASHDWKMYRQSGLAAAPRGKRLSGGRGKSPVPPAALCCSFIAEYSSSARMAARSTWACYKISPCSGDNCLIDASDHHSQKRRRRDIAGCRSTLPKARHSAERCSTFCAATEF